jgi:hypothetical protein
VSWAASCLGLDVEISRYPSGSGKRSVRGDGHGSDRFRNRMRCPGSARAGAPMRLPDRRSAKPNSGCHRQNANFSRPCSAPHRPSRTGCWVALHSGPPPQSTPPRKKEDCGRDVRGDCRGRTGRAASEHFHVVRETARAVWTGNTSAKIPQERFRNRESLKPGFYRPPPKASGMVDKRSWNDSSAAQARGQPWGNPGAHLVLQRNPGGSGCKSVLNRASPLDFNLPPGGRSAGGLGLHPKRGVAGRPGPPYQGESKLNSSP